MGLIVGLLAGSTGIIHVGLIVLFIYFSNIITDYKTNIGTTLYYALFPIAIGGLYEYYTHNNVNFLIGNTLIVSTMIGSFIGSKLMYSLNLRNKTLNNISISVYLIMVLLFIIMGNNLK